MCEKEIVYEQEEMRRERPQGRVRQMIGTGRSEIKTTGPQGISATYGWVRNYGSTWHGGQDVVLLDDPTIRMPDYLGKSISGTVVTARIVTAGEVMGIAVHDHLIIGKSRELSFRSEGLL